MRKKQPSYVDRKSELRLAPWNRGQWHGQLVSVDGCPAHDFTRDDVSEVIIASEIGADDYDGSIVAIVKLNDGRYVGWEASWGPTGDGFSADAYGGDADILFASSVKALFFYMSEDTRSRIMESLEEEI